MATADRAADMAELLGSQTDAATTEMVMLGRVVEEALTATNERLAALERSITTNGSPAARPAEEALSKLRLILQRFPTDPQTGAG